VELDAPVHALDALTGTDTYRGSQWDLTKINVPTAWRTSTGAGVTVAVVDTGVDVTHPDLAGQVLPGADLVAGTTGVSADPNGHGTHVAGTIAAAAGNGIGVAGIAADARILPVRVLGSDGSGMMSTVASGITWAADHGAQVINMSIGSTAQVSAVTNAIAYAQGKGVVVVAAAGNNRSSGSPTNYPAADPGVIAVAATDSTDSYSSYSNQGSYVDVAAPGTSILSTVPTTMGGYAYYSGTSMASPHVAAVAALLKTYNPTLGPEQVERALETSAVDLGAAGRDSDYGYGRIDAAAALAAVTPPSSAPAAPPSSATPTPAITPTTRPTTEPTTAPSTSPTGTPTTAPTTSPAAPPTTRPTERPTTSPTTRPTATPTPTPVRVTPVVTSNAVSEVVPYGTPISTTFTVTVADRPWARQVVQACVAEKNTTTFRCAATLTSAAGTVTVSRTATVSYRVKLTVPATATSNAATSATYSYTVRAKAAVAKGGTSSLTVTVGGAAGQRVQVQRWTGRIWQIVTTHPAVTRFVVDGLPAHHGYRIVVPSTAAIAGTTSESVWL
jgi:serine protease